MEIFYLSPNSLLLLAKFLLSFIVTGYVLFFIKKNEAVNWFCGYLIGYLGLDFCAFAGQTVYAGWVPLNYPLQYFSTIILACCYLQFAYLFRKNSFKDEYKWAKWTSLILGGLCLIYIVYLIFTIGFGSYQTIQILLIYPFLALIWSAVIFFRKYRVAVAETGAESDDRTAFLSFFILTILAILLALAPIFDAFGWISQTLFALMFFVMNLIIFAGVTVTFINYIASRSTVLVKLIGVSLVLLLTVIGVQGIVLIPNSRVQEIKTNHLPLNSTYIFSPGENGYNITQDSLIWEEEKGDENRVNESDEKITLSNSFPFYGSEYNELIISSSGIVKMGDGPLPDIIDERDIWNCLGTPKTISTGCFLFDSLQASQIFIRKNTNGTVITWQFGVEDTNSVQAHLLNDGSIYLSFKNISLNQSQTGIGVIGTTNTGIRRSNANASYTTAAGISAIDFTRNFRDELHTVVAPLAWFLVISTGVILLCFPFFYSKSVLQPLQVLLDGVRRVDAGEYDISIPVKNYDEIGYVTSHFNNMTESLKEANEKLKAYAEELEERVAERTKELNDRNKALADANTRLEEQTEELARMDRMRTRLFTNISHELRTPITLISSPLEKLLNQKNINSEIEHQLKISLRNSARLRQLVEQILDLNRLETGKLSLKVTSLDVAEALKFLTSSFQSMLNYKGVQLTVAISEESTEIFIDPDKFEKIITNLLSNAAKFTSEGESIHVALEEQQDEVKIIVRDTGKGIDPEKLQTVFDRFQTSADDEVDYREGLGIGLAITKEYMELHDGDISVDSEPGSGTTFTLRFKKGSDHFDPEQIHESDGFSISNTNIFQYSDEEDHRKERMPISLSGTEQAHILVVEDNRDMASHLKDILVSEGYLISRADNGQMALEMLEDMDPDLIISDIMMPVMDGMELLEELKKDEKYEDIPTVFLSARSDVEGRLKGLRLGVNDYLVKPFNVTELLFRIENLLEFSQARKQAIIELSDDESPSADEELIEKLTTLVEERISNSTLTIEELASEASMSRRTFYREVKKATGLSAASFVREIRLQKARQKLQKGSVKQISLLSEEVGFSTSRYFSKLYYKRFGKKPSELLT